MDLSSPQGVSVNDGIDKQLSSLSYARIDPTARRVLEAGRSNLLAKLDLQSAYRVVPVPSDDRHLLGMRWNGQVCLDTALPFGLRYAPQIFSAVADALLWAMYVCASTLHYLDDFLFFGEPGSEECSNNLSHALATCRSLSVPVAKHKMEGSAYCMTFLGIEIDTNEGCLRLPENKLRRLCELLREWSHKRACTKRELLSLVGLLHHADTVVKPRRMFVWRLIDLSAILKKLHFHVRLNKEARSDIWWWVRFIERCNGQGLLAAVGRLLPSVTVQ